jgi:hypothetical protein
VSHQYGLRLQAAQVVVRQDMLGRFVLFALLRKARVWAFPVPPSIPLKHTCIELKVTGLNGALVTAAEFVLHLLLLHFCICQ